ncbi:MAG: DNA-directed RNA polymerase subunit omega [Bacteroidota bacterium]|jgi:DNA-directed RNA polymerase subunit K/omega
MSFKNSAAERSTVTRDTIKLEDKTGNVYEAIVVLGKRANQISVEMKEELTAKLQEFASSTDNLEEIFENREQIEISKFYEKMPKPVAIAIQEMLDDEIYVRKQDEQ